MNKKKLSITVAILLLLAGLTYAFWPESQVQKLEQMRKEAFSEGRPDREKMRELREEMNKLPPEQRDQLREQWREDMAARMEQHEASRAAEYFALPAEKRKEYLDKQIAEQEKWRKEMEKRRQEWETSRNQAGQGQGQNGNRPGQNPGGPGIGPAGPSGPGQAGGPGARPPRNRTPESRSARRNQRMDNVSPSQRAQMTAFRQDMAKRRAELGLPAWGPPGGRGPR